MNRYKYILFDLDGTLTDPYEGITKSVQYALNAFGIKAEPLEKLKKFIGPPLKESFMEFYGLDSQQADQAVAKYRERFADVGIFENRLYDGIPEVFKLFKGSRVCFGHCFIKAGSFCGTDSGAFSYTPVF